MHNILGIVKVVIGQVFAIAVDGTQRELHEGDRIFAGEEIVTGANGALTVNLSDGHTMDMGRNSHWSDQSGVSAAANTEHATDDVAALQQAITDGVDPTKALDATAAGNEAPIEPGTGGGGHFIERVELTGEVVNATSGFPTNGLASQVLDNNQFETFPAQSISTTTEALQPILTPPEEVIGTQPPVIDTPVPEQPPVVDTPVPEHPPVVDTPVPEQPPVVDTPVPEQPPVVDTPVPEQPPVVDTPVPEQPPVVDTPVPEQPPVIDTPVPEQPPVVDTPVPEQPPVVDTPVPEQPPVVDTPVPEQPPVVDTPVPEWPPVIDTPVPEQPPVVDTPVPEQPPVVDTPVPEQPPVIDTPVPEQPPVVDTPVPEQPPVVDTPVPEQPPVVDTPVPEQPPMVDTPVPEQPPVVDTPVPEQPPVVDTPVPEQPPVVDTPVPEQPPVVDTPVPEWPPVIDTPVPEQPPVVDTPVPEQPPVVDTPVPEHPPVVDTPVPEQPPVIDTPVPEQPPVVDTPVPEQPPVVDTPVPEQPPTDQNHNINITIDTIETVETPSTDKPNSVISHVNGGSESPDGFDVQDGKIVSIGSNVRIYLSEGDPEPQCADPEHQIQYYNDGNQNGDGQYSDIFVVHPGSQYRQGDGTYHALNSLNGNTQSEQNGHKDYVFVQDGKDTNYQISDGTNNNSETNVNTQESVSISGSDGMGHSLQLQGINHVEGVILGDGTVHTQNKGSTSVETDTPAANPGEQHSIVTGTVTGDVALGDIVKLTINDHHYKGEVVDLGNGKLGYHIGIETGDLKEGLPIHVSITVKDDSGNLLHAQTEQNIRHDQVPSAPSSSDTDSTEHPASPDHDVNASITEHHVSNDATVIVGNSDSTDLTPEAPHSQITHVNGGSESADGFDVQDGKIVSIGSNVHVWLSEGDSEPKCADSNSQIKYYKDGNVNGDGSHADVFVVHEGSGYTRGGNHQGLNGINGTTQSVDGGHKDYVFLQDGKESDFEFSFSSNNNAPNNVNTLDNVAVTGNGGQGLHLQGMNHLEGVIYGDGTVHTPNEGRTSISHSDAPVSVVEHSLLSAAPPAPLVEESTGHAVIEHHAEQSHSLNNLLESSDDLFLPATAPSADSAIHQSGISDLGSDKAQHVDARINLSDLAQELEHGTDITSLIKGTEQSGSETTVIDPKAHMVPAIMSESAGMDSLQHSSFDHLLHKPEHQY
ncbi:retention module-containing protein [Buttiauxella noackiae]|uniref:retention module-containing protein n=1 Tax=Buttiauxella noackiae TaxID=82992 RepID=UPI0006916604|nr:retention module-containing protein [Buttiauxella noackiae]